MTAILKTVLAIVLGVVFYALLFGAVVDKPLSVGLFDRVYSAKRDYARRIDSPKIVVAAGSSGLYSVRCETIAEETGLPCVNLSIAVALGRETIMSQIRQVANPGDLVVLPWEFRLYFLNAEDMRARISYPYIIRHEKVFAPALGLKGALNALFYFDLKYLFQSLPEMRKYDAGGRHQFEKEGRLTLQGDYRGHTAEAGKKFRAEVDALGSSATETRRVAALEVPPEDFARFLDWATRHDIRVLGVLPPSIDTAPVEPRALDNLTAWYGAHKGAAFSVIERNAQYPSTCFYDTREHLDEECQIAHSKKIAAAIERYLETVR